jgi:hypothetical protein
MNSESSEKLVRCPRLGHEIVFSYCLEESLDLPCSRIRQCWSVVFDVEAVLQKKLSAEDLSRFNSSAPKDKVVSIIELIEAAKAGK